MIEKTTTNRNYPKPDASNFLQDDVLRLESALDSIDRDIHTIKQEQTEQNNRVETKADQAAVQSAVDEIKNEKADKSWVESAIGTINNTKADKIEVDSKLTALKEKIYGTAYNIIGPPLAFQYTSNLTYSIEIPDAASYEWTASGVAITAGAAGKAISVSTDTTSGSVSVTVTTEAGNTILKTREITVKRLSDIVTFDYTGTIESWTVPDNVKLIKIEAWGAGGGHGYNFVNLQQLGGKGARMKGEFQVEPGDKFLILVGGRGGEREGSYEHGAGAGGGGTFVVKVDPNSPYQMTVENMEKVTPMIIAGGGGGGGKGTNNGQAYDGGNGLTGTAGGEAFEQAGGTNGSGGGGSNYGDGGAGFSGDGNSTAALKHPQSFLNGGRGGTYNQWACSQGGFGGGGGAGLVPGGGGGYSGGASGGSWSSKGRSGGGGSYNSGSNQNNSEGVQPYHGRVQISW